MTNEAFAAVVNPDIRRLMDAANVEELRIAASEKWEAKQIAEREHDLSAMRLHNAEREYERAQSAYEATKARRTGDPREASRS